MAEKISCDSALFGTECSKDCPGLLASKLIMRYGDGVEVQVCPNPSTLGMATTEVDHNGSGADVIIVHSATLPSEVDFTRIANNFGQ